MGCKSFWQLDSTEHFGWLLCYTFSALISAYILGIYGPALLSIAELAADESGNLAFLGIKWTNVITLPASVGSMCMLFVGPFFGSLADYTSYRKVFGAIAMVGTILCVFTNIFVSTDTIGIILVASSIQIVTYLCVYSMYRAAYLPELAKTEAEVTQLSAKGYLILFVSQLCFMGTLIAAANSFGGADPVAYMRTAAIIVVVVGSLIAVVVITKMGYRPAVSKLEDGENIFTIGFISIYKSFREMATDYTQLCRFMCFTSFANSSFNAAPALAVTYMSALNLSINQISLVLGLTLVVGIGGPILVTVLKKKFDLAINKIMMVVICLYMVFIISFPFLAMLGYGLIIFGGMGIGLTSGMWLASGQAFFASLCPGGKEATFTGCYMFANKVLDWSPPLVFSVVNQSTNNLILSYYCATLIFVLASVILCYTIDMEKGKKEIKDTLKDRRLSVIQNDDETKLDVKVQETAQPLDAVAKPVESPEESDL